MINNELIVPKKINVSKYKANKYQKIEREMIGPVFIERCKIELSNIIVFPENKFIKSGL